MNGTFVRPDRLEGKTYRIQHGETVIRITINDAEIDDKLRPIELFINDINAEDYQWITIFARLVSAIFRKGGDYTFMIEEMKMTMAPKDGAWVDGVWVPSLVAQIGAVIEKHLTTLS